MTILFLYSEVMGYTESVFESLPYLNNNLTVHCVHWDKNNKNPNKPKFDRVVYYQRSQFIDKILRIKLEVRNNKIIKLKKNLKAFIFYFQ